MSEAVYHRPRDTPGMDKVELPRITSGKSRKVHHDGIRDLLGKGFLYNTPLPGQFFVNILYMFNGDRLAFVKAYHRVRNGSSTVLPDLTKPTHG
jgi:hypothetical protein